MNKIGNDLNNISIAAKNILDIIVNEAGILLNDKDYFARNEVLDSMLHIIKKDPLLFERIVEGVTSHESIHQIITKRLKQWVI